MATETARRSTILPRRRRSFNPAAGVKTTAGSRIYRTQGAGKRRSAQAIRGTPNTHPSRRHRHLPPTPGFQLSVEKNPYPRVNGLEMVDRLLENKRDIRIILMSSTPGADLHSRGLIREGLPS